MIQIAKPVISDDEISEVARILKSGRLTSGETVKKFERNFADYIGTRHAIAAFNGTSALHTALLTSGIKPGDEVITTPFSFVASSNCILYAGGKPVFVDIDPKTYNIDSGKIEEKITDKTRAVLIVHLFGQPCEMGSIVDLCKDRKLILIEDACQSHGAEYKGKKVGSFGDIAVFSFYATKNVATGEGGMITTNDDDKAKMARTIIDQGQEKKYYHTMLGFNFRMMEVQAAIGIGQLARLDENNGKRISNAKFLTENLSGITRVETPFVSPKIKHVFHQYVIRCKNREELRNHLLKNGIESSIHYPLPIYKQPLYENLGYRDSLQNAETASQEVLSLPIHPSLSGKDLETIVTEVRRFYEK